MEKLNTLISLNEAKTAIDELIAKVKSIDTEETDTRKLLIWVLSIIGAIAVVAGIAYAVYRHFSEDYLDDYEDLDDMFEDEDEDEEDLEEEDDDFSSDLSDDDFED